MPRSTHAASIRVPVLTPSVAVRLGNARYCEDPPFHPSGSYPEAPFRDVSAAPNEAYRLLRKLFGDLGFDPQHAGTAQWNPLAHLVEPGQTVLLKPNFVLHRNDSGQDPFAVVTHPSVLRALADYVFLALRGEGRIVIADAPQMNCDWDALMRLQRLDRVQDLYHSRHRFPIEIYDLRNSALLDSTLPAFPSNRQPLPGDPLGSTLIDLGPKSLFNGLPSERFYGADYDRQETIRHHHGAKHEYLVSQTVLSADTFISVPKLKTHKKVGVTLNCKGLVGINTDKNYLIHYRVGTPSRGGDQLPDQVARLDRSLVGLQRWCYDHLLAGRTRSGELLYKTLIAGYRATLKPFRHIDQETIVQDSGNWHGNDSAWRMTADLFRIIRFADRHGQLRETPQRRMFSVIDGLVAGDLEGPLAPRPVSSGALIAGHDFLDTDVVATRLIGIDPRRLRQFDSAFGPGAGRDLQATAAFIDGHSVPVAALLDAGWPSPLPPFLPHAGWQGKIESEARRSAA